MNQKFQTIIDSYINGNIAWAKSEVKKLSKENRKALHLYYSLDLGFDDNFFFNLI